LPRCGPFVERRGKDASHQLLQPTYNPSTPRTARFPGALPVEPRDPRGPSARQRTLTHHRPTASGEPPGEASLDGEPPASASSQPALDPHTQGFPLARRRAWCCAVLAERRSNAPRALHLPTAALSTASRACDVASDALCRGPAGRPDLSVEPIQRDRQAPPPPSSRQRRPLRRHQDAFPRRVLSPLQERLRLSLPPFGLAPPPRPRLRAGPEAQAHREPATVLPALPP